MKMTGGRGVAERMNSVFTFDHRRSINATNHDFVGMFGGV